MRVPEPDKLKLLLNQPTLECRFNFGALIIVPVNVASNSGAGQEVRVVASSKETYVVNLRDARRKKLEGSGNQILGFPPSKGIEERAVDLV